MLKEYNKRDRLLKTLGFTNYDEYLSSELWQSIRTRAYKRDNKCRICDQPAQCIHHTSYSKQVLLGKTLVGLVPLCHDCHYTIEYTEDGWKRTLDRANNKLQCLIMANSVESQILPKVRKPKKKKQHKCTNKPRYKKLKISIEVYCLHCEHRFRSEFKLKHSQCPHCLCHDRTRLVIWKKWRDKDKPIPEHKKLIRKRRRRIAKKHTDKSLVEGRRVMELSKKDKKSGTSPLARFLPSGKSLDI